MSIYSTFTFQLKKILKNYLTVISISIVFSLAVASCYLSSNETLQQPILAQNTSLPLSDTTIKKLFDIATSSLQQSNIDETKKVLEMIQSSLLKTDTSASLPLANTKVFVNDAIESVNSKNITKALSYISLATKNLGGLQPNNNNTSQNIAAAKKDDFKTYDNPLTGIRMAYPKNWTVIEYRYNPISNNTIAGFYSNGKTSSELGNISGVSGNFVPYLDVFEFNSKNMSLNDISQGIMKKFSNTTKFAIEESKPILLRNNKQGFEITYDVNVGTGEHLRKLQAYTLIGDKAYTISFTSQRDLFADYLPIANEMINSFESTNKTR
jgi:hypothetical protein